ncbi:GP46-like surface antigen, putative [Bodo saltans]|uniref:GP46-like surface antigen, putative n=1 Tax=Bodo saltans TaxID=75058 RepID=A0A0S4KHF9_BODSA|nr:GP46-like surface antigen, putative [Bodo saltans]|eukprot:CUI13261.1 GP46-like surface antigen, putative [Bodo saltans]
MNALNSTVPQALFALPALKHLSIGLNEFTGTIPSVISMSLVFLDIQNCSGLVGVLPFRSMLVCPTALLPFQYCIPANVVDLFISTEIQDLATGIAMLAPYASSCVPPPSSTTLPSLAPRPAVPAAWVGNTSSLLGPETRFIGTTVAAASSIAGSSSNGAVRGAVPSVQRAAAAYYA